jgi:alpha-mannosidase
MSQQQQQPSNWDLLRRITLERAEKYLSKETWTDVNLFGKLYKARDPTAVAIAVWSVPIVDPNNTDIIKYEEAIKQNFASTSVGTSFGPSWSTHWFKGTDLNLENKIIFLSLILVTSYFV